MPFTEEQFFQVFALYNRAVWPAQVAAYLLGAVAVALVFVRSRAATTAICAVLAAMWLVNGAGYHWWYFADVNPAARMFGAVFIVEAVLLGAAPLLSGRFRIAARADPRTAVGLAVVAFAMLVYPVWGYLAGHAYPSVPVFGVAPCPTTIFTIGLLLTGTWHVTRWLLVIPALWAALGGSAALVLGVPQDYGLLAALAIVGALVVARLTGSRLARHETAPG